MLESTRIFSHFLPRDWEDGMHAITLFVQLQRTVCLCVLKYPVILCVLCG
jgi:hypothetical protein